MSIFSNVKKLNILVLGDLMVDSYITGSVDRISAEAPIQIVRVKQKYKKLGGAGNVINNLISLGVNVKAAGCVGNDIEGKWLKTEFERLNINTDNLILSDSRVTTVKTRISSRNQQLVRYDEEVTDYLSKSEEDAILSGNILDKVDAVIISDYGKGVITPVIAQTIIKKSADINIPVFVDPKGDDYSKYYGATICTPNMKEFKDVIKNNPDTEEDILCNGIELADKTGLKYLLLTRSEKGLSLIDRSKREKFDFPAKAKEVIDVTGAGDTVISAFAVCYTLGMSLSDCCRISNLAASDVVSKFGTATTTIETISNLIIEESDSKIISFDEAIEWSRNKKSEGKKVVFTNGCFDILHAGHISSFKKAKSQGDYLIVGINSDNSVKRIKGPKRPIIDEFNRAKMLEAISYIDKVFIFDEDFPESVIQKISPNVLIKGKDWEGKPVAGSEFVKQNGGEVVFIDLEEGLSTTSIIGKILESNK